MAFERLVLVLDVRSVVKLREVEVMDDVGRDNRFGVV